jgi:hypothetical protein
MHEERVLSAVEAGFLLYLATAGASSSLPPAHSRAQAALFAAYDLFARADSDEDQEDEDEDEASRLSGDLEELTDTLHTIARRWRQQHTHAALMEYVRTLQKRGMSVRLMCSLGTLENDVVCFFFFVR